ncbi:MAG: FeoA family protein [Candidatus Atabeyarchaeum deiterrae]
MQRTERYLTELAEGETGIVVDVETENCPERGKRRARRGVSCTTDCASRWGAVQRITQLGVPIGTEVTLTNSSHSNGSLEVSVRDFKIVLDSKLASKIIVATLMRGKDLRQGSQI